MDKKRSQYLTVELFIAALVFPYSVCAWDGGTQQYSSDPVQSNQQQPPQSTWQNQGQVYPPSQASPQSNVNPWAIPPQRGYQGPVQMRPWGQVPPGADTSSKDKPDQYPSYNPNPYPVPPDYQYQRQGAPYNPYGQYSPYGGTYGNPSWGRGNYGNPSWGRGNYGNPSWGRGNYGNPYGSNIGGFPGGGIFPPDL